MTSLHSSLPSPGRTSWRKDLSAIARDPNTQYLRVRHVVIRGTEINQKPSPYVVYKIDVVTESNNWFVYKRYSQFHSLHFKLHKKFSLSWDLFPKKLVSGNLDPKTISIRKKLLEHYLQKLINSDSNIAMCEELLHFLDVYYHDVVYVTRSLSSFVFKHGDSILSKQQLFQLSPTEVYCIGKRLKLPVETSPSDARDSSQDLGHLFSFIHQLHNLMIAQTWDRPEHRTFLRECSIRLMCQVFPNLSLTSNYPAEYWPQWDWVETAVVWRGSNLRVWTRMKTESEWRRQHRDNTRLGSVGAPHTSLCYCLSWLASADNAPGVSSLLRWSSDPSYRKLVS